MQPTPLIVIIIKSGSFGFFSNFDLSLEICTSTTRVSIALSGVNPQTLARILSRDIIDQLEIIVNYIQCLLTLLVKFLWQQFLSLDQHANHQN